MYNFVEFIRKPELTQLPPPVRVSFAVSFHSLFVFNGYYFG